MSGRALYLNVLKEVLIVESGDVKSHLFTSDEQTRNMLI